ncbi:MAG: DinB family protein [bacterium]|nr:DinB family protein [bacterium]
MDLKLAADDLLYQLETVVEQLKEEDFSKPLQILSDASLGQHVRHTLEFFICLVDARNEGVINYDNRKHDKVIEQDKSMALSVIKSMREFVMNVDGNIELRLDMSYGFEQGDEEILSVKSNLLRELAYNIEHAVHHMALLKIGVATEFTYVKLPEHFGVASSTVRYKAGN